MLRKLRRYLLISHLKDTVRVRIIIIITHQ